MLPSHPESGRGGRTTDLAQSTGRGLADRMTGESPSGPPASCGRVPHSRTFASAFSPIPTTRMRGTSGRRCCRVRAATTKRSMRGVSPEDCGRRQNSRPSVSPAAPGKRDGRTRRNRAFASPLSLAGPTSGRRLRSRACWRRRDGPKRDDRSPRGWRSRAKEVWRRSRRWLPARASWAITGAPSGICGRPLRADMEDVRLHHRLAPVLLLAQRRHAEADEAMAIERSAAGGDGAMSEGV